MQRLLTYKQIQAMKPELMTLEDRIAVLHWTAKTNRRTAKLFWISGGLQLIGLLLRILASIDR